MMKSLLILVAFLAIFINNSNCSKSSKKCKESSFRPCESFDIKKFAGKWYTYARYENGMGKKNTCAFCEIIYNKCKDKYRIKHNSFINDVAEPIQQAWIDTPTENGIVNFLWDNKDSIARIYITEVDYEKYALVRGCYGKKRKLSSSF